MNSPQRQAGVALLIAVTVVAIVAVSAATLAHKVELGRSRTESLLRGAQASRVILGAEDFVSHILQRDGKDTEYDSLGEPWATPVVLPIDDGTLEGQITEQHYGFNINNLLEPPDQNADEGVDPQPYISQFERLLSLLDLDPNLVWPILDWIDANAIPNGATGMEDDGYLLKTPAYRTANQPMLSITELRLIEGVDDEVYKKLSPHVCALPKTTPVNINTATLPVLQALHPDITPDKAQILYDQARTDKGFEKIDDFRDHEQLQDIAIPPALISVKSEYFQVRANVTIGNTTVSLYSAIHRESNGTPRLLYRSRGTI